MQRKQNEDIDLNNADENEPPPREALHDEVHGDGHGGTEMGWLVSYADMMTLLFGLFVILFSLASDKSKSVTEVMKQVSEKYFSQSGQAPTPAADPHNAFPEQPPKPETPPAAEMKSPQSEPTPEKPTDTEVTELKAKIEKLESEKKQVDSEKQALEKEKKSLQRKIASTEDPTAEVDSLKKELSAQQEENKKLQDEVTKKKAITQNYMMVVATWQTEKHDIDLQVVNPHNKTFNFKRRQIASEPGKFELDSRFGPGIEMWKAENFTPGTYHAKMTFYSKNGNTSDAKVRLTVTTNLATYNSPNLTMKKIGEVVDVPFTITNEGVVEFGLAGL